MANGQAYTLTTYLNILIVYYVYFLYIIYEISKVVSMYKVFTVHTYLRNLTLSLLEKFFICVPAIELYRRHWTFYFILFLKRILFKRKKNVFLIIYLTKILSYFLCLCTKNYINGIIINYCTYY